MIKRLRNVFEGCVPVDEVICCTDSQVALCWVKNSDTEYGQYVRERVKEIRMNTGMGVWHHVPGKENPADLPSRGCQGDKVDFLEWERGPDWLSGKRVEWPINAKCRMDLGSDEKRKPKLECVTLQANPVSVMGIQNLLDAKEFSDFDKLLRVTGWVVRFVDVCRGSRRSRGDTLTADELLRAERMWAKSVQVGIQKGDNFEKISKSLGFFKDEHGVLRCGGG